MKRPQTKMVRRPIQASRNQERIVPTDARSRPPTENLKEADFGTPAFLLMVATAESQIQMLWKAVIVQSLVLRKITEEIQILMYRASQPRETKPYR
jgi:hypothetical protein